MEKWRNFGNIVITRLVWKISRVGRMEKMFDSRAGIEGVVVIVDREEK